MKTPVAAVASATVLTKAVLRAAQALGVNQKRLSPILGLSEATVSRLGRTKRLDPESKEGELALLFVRLFRSLDTLVGGNAEQARSWLWAHNSHLGGVPAERIATVSGLVDAVSYLDALRGKL